MSTQPPPAQGKNAFSRMLSCLRERRAPDSLLAFVERRQEQYGPAYYRWIQNRRLRAVQDTSSYRAVRDICATALAAGNAIRMDGIVYGPAHWEKTGVLNQPRPYYNFLAGFIHSQNATRVVEVGTWYGGSALAMQRGFDREARDRVIVTIDSRQRNLDAFRGRTDIVPVEGDAADDRIVDVVAARVQPRIDLLFIDADHRYLPTKAVVTKYGNRLRPKWMILDNIHCGWSMEKAWACIHTFYPRLAYDAGIDLGFQAPTGFGVVDCREIQQYGL